MNPIIAVFLSFSNSWPIECAQGAHDQSRKAHDLRSSSSTFEAGFESKLGECKSSAMTILNEKWT